MGARASIEPPHARRVTLAGPHVRLEAFLEEPRSVERAAVVLHGGGGSFRDGLVRSLSTALGRRASAVLRLNFRGVGRSTGRFYVDLGKGERTDVLSAIELLAARYRGVPLWVAGISFGAWIGLEVGLSDRRVTGLLGVALPLRIEEFDLSYLRRKKTKPLAVVQGGDDEYGPRKEIVAFVSRLRDPKRLLVVDRASHAFTGKRDALAATVHKAVAWLARRA